MLYRRPTLRAPAVSSGSVSITFKGLGAYDYPSAFTWPSPQDEEVTSAAERSSGHAPRSSTGVAAHASADRSGDYATHHRSPYSVLRSRQSRVNRCAAGMLGTSFDTSTRYLLHKHTDNPCAKPFCCCSALFYPAAAISATAGAASPPAPHHEAADRVRDDFLWALRLGAVEDLLRTTLGFELHARLMEGLNASPVSAAVLACSDPVRMAQLMVRDANDAALAGMPSVTGTAYIARLLLSADEDNRIRWLQEESASMEPSDYYSRAPSLRALFIMWSVLQHQQRLRSTAVLGGGEDVRARELEEDLRDMDRSRRDDFRRDRTGNSWTAEASHLPRGHHDGVGGPRVRSPASARSPSSLVPCPQMSEIRHVLLRMEERRMEVTMSDIAALAAIGAGGSGATAVPDSEFWDSLAKLLKPQEVAAALRTLAAPASSGQAAPSNSSDYPSSSGSSNGLSVTEEMLGLQHVLLLCLLLRYVLRVRAEVAQREAATSQPLSPSALASHNKLLLPITAFEAASDVIQLRKSLTESLAEGEGKAAVDVRSADGAGQRAASAIRDAIVVLSDVVLKHAYEMAETSHIPASSPHLPELTTWLLREMVSSPVCEFHFKRLVDRSITEALVALEKSGLVNRSTIDLKVVVRQLLPLLESCGSEDLYTSVLRDVLSALEEKARRDGYDFSAEDLRYLAELGTKLFSSGPPDSTAGGYGLFDETARGQMEELHVMDGSPWALCVSSYRSLKEMLQGIVRDQRRLKEQVQDQLRQLSNASSLSAVMTGTGGESEAQEAAKAPRSSERASLDAGGTPKPPGTTTAAPPASSSSTATAAETSDVKAPAAKAKDSGEASAADAQTAEEAAAAAAGPAAPPRIPVPPMLRQRFLVLIEDLVKSQVDESSAQSEKPIVVSSELFAFVTQHVPVPNIQDEYRRKIFLLVNVAEDPETTRQRIAQRRQERQRRLRSEAAAKAASNRASSSGSGGVSRLRRAGRKLDSKHEAGMSGVESDRGLDDHTGSASEAERGKAEAEEGREKEGVEGELGDEEADTDPHGGANDIPAELRFLVSSLPLTLSPWASVMILREVLAESAGRNPRYTYVLNAAIDLQLPMSTTRSRIATTLNMWRFLNTQAHKLSLKESLVMKQRCAWNLPLSYILSSYWSLLTWLALASIVTLNVVGIDWESQIVANSLFRMFAPWEEICAAPAGEESAEEAWTTQATADLAADYFEQAEIADRRREEHRRSSTNVFLSSASYLILGYDDQRRPMTVIPIGSDRAAAAEARVAEEYAGATAVLRELSLHAPFPFFVDIERALPLELVEMRIAERIRRVSFNNTWFLPRMIIRTFPLGRQYTEHKLILHTCTQANLTRRRVTFLLYMHDGVAITPQFIQKLNESYLCKHANLVLVVHESSLLKGGTTPDSLAKISQASAHRSADSLESIANAAADMIEAVLPEEVKETAAGGPVASAAAAATTAAALERHVRVLPFCRQYYAKDGTAVSDALRGREQLAAMRERAASSLGQDGKDGGWWSRLASYVPGSHKRSSEAAAAAAAVAAAEEAAASLPLFASAFSDQRTSLHRSHQQQQQQQQCEAEQEAAAQQQQQQQHGALRRGASFMGQWVQWWRQTLTGATVMATESMMRVTPDGSWEASDETARASASAPGEAGQAKPHEDGAAENGSRPDTATAATTPEQAPRGDSFPSGFRDDAMEDRAGRDVVSVSFTALRRLMAEVSAPVPIPRKKSTSGGGSGGSAVATLPLTEAGCDGADDVRGLRERKVVHAAPAPAVPSEGRFAHFWASYYGASPTPPHAAGDDAAKGKEDASQAAVSTPPPPPSPVAVAALRPPYNFVYHTNSNNPANSDNTNGSSGSATASASTDNITSLGGSVDAAKATLRSSGGGEAPSAFSSGAAAVIAAATATSNASAPASPLASSLSFSSLPATNLTRHNTFKWDSEWQKADEMLAQLRRSNRTNA